MLYNTVTSHGHIIQKNIEDSRTMMSFYMLTVCNTYSL